MSQSISKELYFYLSTSKLFESYYADPKRHQHRRVRHRQDCLERLYGLSHDRSVGLDEGRALEIFHNFTSFAGQF